MAAKKHIENNIKSVRRALFEAVPETSPYVRGETPTKLNQVMREYLLQPDRNFTPSVLCILACQLVGGSENFAMSAARAIAMVETIRVINDELPSMNADDPADVNANCNCEEAMVVLAGGALIARAFSQITIDIDVPIKWKSIVRVVGELARAAGSLAASKGDEIAQLYECSAVVGAIVGGGSEDQIQRLRMYGRCVGHAAVNMKNAKDELMKPRSDGEDGEDDVECFDEKRAARMLILTDCIAP